MPVADDGSRAVVMVVDDGVEAVVWQMPDGVRPDLSTVDALARLRLAARRAGWTIKLRNPCDDLRALLALVGMTDLFPEATHGADTSADESGRQPEGGEHLGVEEVVQPRDPSP